MSASPLPSQRASGTEGRVPASSADAKLLWAPRSGPRPYPPPARLPLAGSAWGGAGPRRAAPGITPPPGPGFRSRSGAAGGADLLSQVGRVSGAPVGSDGVLPPGGPGAAGMGPRAPPPPSASLL